MRAQEGRDLADLACRQILGRLAHDRTVSAAIHVEGQLLLEIPSMLPSQLSPIPHGKNRRRSQRLILRVPVVAYRSPKLGLPFSEGTHTLVVSAHGALIILTAKVAADQKFVLKHGVSGEEQECRVVYTRKNAAGPPEVGIEFRQSAPNFWHIAFPPGDWMHRK